jgi:hypothetical protein
MEYITARVQPTPKPKPTKMPKRMPTMESLKLLPFSSGSQIRLRLQSCPQCG